MRTVSRIRSTNSSSDLCANCTSLHSATPGHVLAIIHAEGLRVQNLMAKSRRAILHGENFNIYIIWVHVVHKMSVMHVMHVHYYKRVFVEHMILQSMVTVQSLPRFSYPFTPCIVQPSRTLRKPSQPNSEDPKSPTPRSEFDSDFSEPSCSTSDSKTAGVRLELPPQKHTK